MQSARPGDLPQLIAAADSVFRSAPDPELGSMGRDYPLLFDPDNAANLIIARGSNGEVISHVGFNLRGCSIQGQRALVACFGSVFTLAAYRGHGLATGLLDAAVARARAAGADIGLVSGARGLYSRAGFIDHPPFRRYRVEPPARRDRVSIQPAGQADADELVRLQAGETVRFERPAEDWRRVLAAGMVLYHPGTVFLVEREGRAVAYLAVGRPRAGVDGVRGARVLELAGDREAAVAAMPAVLERLGPPALEVVLPEHDRSLEQAAARAGWPADEVTFPFSFKVWNPALEGLPLPFYGLNYV